MIKSEREYNKVLNSAMLEVAQNQLRDGEPPEARQTYERLIAAGYSDEEALNMIGYVVSCEIFEVMKNQKPYDRDRYVSALLQLPSQ